MSEFAAPAPQYVAPLTTVERAAQLGATVPQDHQDGDNSTAVVHFKGHAYTVNFAAWSFEVMDLFETGRMMAAFRTVFGDEQFDAMKTRLNFFEDYEPFLKVINKARTAGK